MNQPLERTALINSWDDVVPLIGGALVTCVAAFVVALLSRSPYAMVGTYAAGFGSLTYVVAPKARGWVRALAVLAGLSWIAAFVAALTFGSKFYGAVAFVVCLLSVMAAGTALRRTRFAISALIPAIYFGAFLGSQVLRQILYELGTKGHVTNLYDSCAASFTLLMVPFSLVYLIVGGCVVSAGVLLTRRFDAQLRRAVLMTLLVIFALLSVQSWQSGWHGWVDAQINQPCL